MMCSSWDGATRGRPLPNLRLDLVDPRSTEHLKSVRILVHTAMCEAKTEGLHMLNGKLN